MKRLLVGIALFAAACTGTSPTAPSGTQSSVVASQTPATPVSGTGSGPTVDPTPGGPNNNAAVPQFSLSGPRNNNNCFTSATDAMQWILNVTDAGPRALHLIALVSQDDTPGCDATAKNPRARIDMSGVTDYTPHSTGTTTFTFNPRMYNCGRVQVDVSIFDSTGAEILIIGTVINYGSQCTNPNPLICSPGTVQSGPAGSTFNFTATGGNGTYTWSSPGGLPTSGSGVNYTSQFNTAGTFAVTVSSGGQSAVCPVNTTPVTVVPVCTPLSQIASPNTPVTFTASLGVGNYAWTSDGSPASGTGATYTASFATVGTHTVRLTSNGISAESPCVVIVSSQLICAPPNQTVGINQAAPMSAAGGNGTYSWNAPGANLATGAGPNFSPSYPASGSYTVTVTSGNQTATCLVTVPPPPA